MALFTVFIGIICLISNLPYTFAWPWQSESILPTDLVGAHIGIWKNTLHLINGVYNATKLNYPENNENLVLWLTADLSSAISITSSDTASFAITPTAESWDISTTTNSLGAFSCFSKCSAQIDQYLYVISPERIDDNMPTGYLVVYDLETQQLVPPPIGLLKTPYYLNGGACVVHNTSHLFSLGGYSTQCPSPKFNERCQDAVNVIIHSTITHDWFIGAELPNDRRIDAGACAIDNVQMKIYLFGGYDKFENAMSDKISKYMIAADEFDLSFDQRMSYKRSEFNAMVDTKQNFAYLIGGAIGDSMSTGQLIEVYDMTNDRFIAVRDNGLSHSIRWYGSEVYAYNDSIDLLLIVGGHTGRYESEQDFRQNMTDYVQYLMINEHSERSEFSDYPTLEPTGNNFCLMIDILTMNIRS